MSNVIFFDTESLVQPILSFAIRETVFVPLVAFVNLIFVIKYVCSPDSTASLLKVTVFLSVENSASISVPVASVPT